MSKATNEWYTPDKYIQAVRRVLGDIDLDPASSAIANNVVQAKRIYTQEDDGLSKKWYGRVYLNPPFGKINGQDVWTRRIIAEYEAGNIEQAILLVASSTDVSWFQPLWNYPICFVYKRINYYSPTPDNFTRTHQSRFGTVFVYFGDNEDRFIDIFSQFGRVAKAVDRKPKLPQIKALWDETA